MQLAEAATQVGVVIHQVERVEALAGTRRADIGALGPVSVVLERCCCCLMSPTLVVASSQAGVDLENRHLLFMREYIHHK